MTQQGDVAHWLYVLTAGEAHAVLEEDGQRRVVGTITAGGPDSFFGEMGMLTGAPRTVSVIAHTDADCYRLDKTGFEEILRARPAIAEGISEVVARRRADLTAAQQKLDESARQRLLAANRHEFLGRIRRFFALG